MMKSRALLVQRGSPPTISGALLQQKSPAVGEVLVQVRAAALTPTDVHVCKQEQQLVDALQPIGSGTFIPGFFFCGEALALGPFVEGLAVGEQVLGVLDGSALSGSAGAVDEEGRPNRQEGEALTDGGCYRERFCVHFSCLVPAASLAAKLHLPSVIAHLPPMVDALFCAASHLRLRAGDALLVVVPRLVDAIFLLQRLFLMQDAWIGPLYLILQHGRAPTRNELERHPMLKPLLAGAKRGGEAEPTLLDEFMGLSIEEHFQHQGSTAGAGISAAAERTPQAEAEALRKLVAIVSDSTSGMGVDVVLALGVDLAPLPESSPEGVADDDAVAVSLESASPSARPSLTALRALISALALRGRFITSCKGLELGPADTEHLWSKECSVSFLNPHCLLLSAARRGTMLHAVVEVVGRIARGELPVAESEVVQYRLFEQFHHAMEACSGRGARSPVGSAQLTVLMI